MLPPYSLQITDAPLTPCRSLPRQLNCCDCAFLAAYNAAALVTALLEAGVALTRDMVLGNGGCLRPPRTQLQRYWGLGPSLPA